MQREQCSYPNCLRNIEVLILPSFVKYKIFLKFLAVDVHIIPNIYNLIFNEVDQYIT